jgi:hypothetical protein
MIWSSGKGLGLFNHYRSINTEVGHGIFTYQLCEWLKEKGYAKDAERLVVISDSQDIDAHYGLSRKPDTHHIKRLISLIFQPIPTV